MIPSGVGDLRGEKVEQITLLNQKESISVDPDRLEELYAQLGDPAAGDIICRAMEEIAARLAYADKCYGQGTRDDLHKNARGLAAIAEQIGMQLLARVARDVAQSVRSGDQVALAATFARLLRVGDRSLCDVWDFYGASI